MQNVSNVVNSGMLLVNALNLLVKKEGGLIAKVRRRLGKYFLHDRPVFGSLSAEQF